MAISVAQIVEPKAVNFVPNDNRVFKRASVENEIKAQNQARFESIDDIDLSEFAQNYLTFYENQAAEFSVESLSDDAVTSVERKDLVSFKLFKQADQPATSTGVDTDNKITASELETFLNKTDFYLNQIGVLVPDSEVSFDEFAFFATKLNDIYRDVETGNKDVNLQELTSIVNNNVDANKFKTFEKVLDAVIAIVDVTHDVERPTVFGAYV